MKSQRKQQPTFLKILRTRGMRAAINFWAERLCVKVINAVHKDAREHGYNLARPDYKTPWWFRIVSRIEFWTRKSRKQNNEIKIKSHV